MLFYSFLTVNFRNGFLFFMNIILPVVLLLLFGSVFGKQESQITVAFYSDRQLTDLNSNWNRLESIPTVEEMKEMDRDIVIIANNGKIDVYLLSSFSSVDSEVTMFRLKYASAQNEKPIVNIVENKITFKRQLSDLEYIMIGVIAISLFSVGMNAGVTLFSEYVQYGLFRRFMLTNVNRLYLLLSATGAQIITGIISSGLVIAISWLIFKVNLFISPQFIFMYLFVVFASIMVSLGLGVVLSLIFKKSASTIAQILYTIFMFFSGVYFPITFLPKPLQIVSYFTPPRYMHVLFQKVYGIDIISIQGFWITCVLFIVIGAALGSYAIGKFLKPA
ncbi:MAG TPA: ABC transporter permease [Fervidobacterium sp.]|nr:ABC transporter permease [Fervidobacterium sp.]HPT54452.1 ABC transporter permease [Fervidobacterium sp.]HPZ17830.1 ABC transporter permease [Fervidobacterium sp.]HUM42777.1 ABC transporter permease [Fervidobacterium sp.]